MKIKVKEASIDLTACANSSVCKHIKKTGAYESDTLSFLMSFYEFNKKSLFINVGANIFFFPLIMSKLFKDEVEIFAFEPSPEHVILGEGLRASNNSDFVIIPKALGSIPGYLPFYLSSKSDSSNSLNPKFREGFHRGVISVEVDTLDNYFLKNNPNQKIKQIIERSQQMSSYCLLLDTESTEPDVLLGGEDLIRKTRPFIVVEVLPGRTDNAINDFIKKLDYIPYRMTNDSLVMENFVFGDKEYTHRDWVLAPHLINENIINLYAQNISFLKSKSLVSNT